MNQCKKVKIIKNNVFSIKVSINEDYKKELDFYTKDYSLSKLFNVLLEEVKANKSFKFKILKKLSKI